MLYMCIFNAVYEAKIFPTLVKTESFKFYMCNWKFRLLYLNNLFNPGP